MMGDMALGAVVLVGDHNWRKGPMWRALAAFLLGRRQRFVHLGMKCTVAWYKDQPFLINLRETREPPHGD